MKKIYMLLGSALTAATALAFVSQPVPELENAAKEFKVMESDVQVANTSRLLKSNLNGTRADEVVGEAKVSCPFKYYFMGLTADLRGPAAGSSWALTPSWGKLNLSAVAAGATKYTWDWDNGVSETSQYYQTFTADGADLEINYEPVSMSSNIAVTASNGDNSQVASAVTSLYMHGTRFATYFGSDNANYATIYPLAGSGTRTNFASYDKTAAQASSHNELGAGNNLVDAIWRLNSVAETDITNVEINMYGYDLPAQTSPYFFTTMYAWFNYTVTEATVVKGGIYKIENNVIQSTPLAILSGNLKAGNEVSEMVKFTVTPVDEDGDEIEGDFVCEEGVDYFVKIEGFNTNEAITAFTPVYGGGTTEAADGSRGDWYINSYVGTTFDYKGDKKSSIIADPWGYNSGFVPANFYWEFDIIFPYVINPETGGRDFNVEVPVAGGEKTVGVEPYYYQLKALVENDIMSAEVEGDWLEYTISEPDAETGISNVVIKAAALPAGVQGRAGAIKFAGKAQDFTINVTQGEVSSVGEIEVDVNAETVYYDLQGRKVMGTPDKGIYIVKEGNKARKVVL